MRTSRTYTPGQLTPEPVNAAPRKWATYGPRLELGPLNFELSFSRPAPGTAFWSCQGHNMLPEYGYLKELNTDCVDLISPVYFSRYLHPPILNTSHHQISAHDPPSSGPQTHSLSESYYQVVAPNLFSDFERIHFFHGVSRNPPELVWRSDHETNPFPVPPKGTRFFKVAPKTANGVFETDLNPVWGTVAPLIIALFKELGIKYSALLPVRFSTPNDEGKQILGPVGLWISTHPGKNTPKDARDASAPILQILETHGVMGVVTYWYEGSVAQLASLMPPADSTDPTCNIRRPLTTVLGMPLAPAESKKDATGSLGFYFHDGSLASAVAMFSATTPVVHEYPGGGTGAPKQDVLVCGNRGFQQLLDDTRDVLADKVEKAAHLATEIAEAAKALERKKEDLARLNQDKATLERHLQDVTVNWGDIEARSVGHVDYVPSIDVGVDENHYTRDFGTFELKASKFQADFLGNVVDLGDKYDSQELKRKFWTNAANRKGFKFPADRLLKIGNPLTRQLLANPDCVDYNGDPLYVVGKCGSKTGFTLGRCSGLEGYICSQVGLESKEIVVYNFDLASGNFSDHGDSGALIFNGEGGGLALLHSGMPRGMYSHVTFGTPLWWIIEQLLLRYPNAIFDRTTF